MDSFDFLAIPSLNKTMVLELARCEFLTRRENVLLLGNSDPATFCTSLLHY
jgi:DNA replication protein DnaC